MNPHIHIAAQTLPASLIQVDAGAFVQRQSLIDIRTRLKDREHQLSVRPRAAQQGEFLGAVPMSLDRITDLESFYRQLFRFGCSIKDTCRSHKEFMAEVANEAERCRDRDEFWEEHQWTLHVNAYRSVPMYWSPGENVIYRVVNRIWNHREKFVHPHVYKQRGVLADQLDQMGITDVRDRQSMGARLGNTMRDNTIRSTTIQKIESALLTHEGELTRKGFARHAHMCIRTVRAHWEQIVQMHAALNTQQEDTQGGVGMVFRSPTGLFDESNIDSVIESMGPAVSPLGSGSTESKQTAEGCSINGAVRAVDETRDCRTVQPVVRSTPVDRTPLRDQRNSIHVRGRGTQMGLDDPWAEERETKRAMAVAPGLKPKRELTAEQHALLVTYGSFRNYKSALQMDAIREGRVRQ